MAILEKDIVRNSGLVKDIDQDSLDMIIDMVQINLYKYPEDSAIREYFSNMYDSLMEKFNAIKILKGEAKVSDFYVEDDSRKETKTSKFNPEYYSLDHLDGSISKATISYVDDADNGKDMIFFSDYGVGLDLNRLLGSMKIGYSTKRLSNAMIGKFGAGAKSALATNVDFYVLESWYNGLYTKMMVYDHFFNCIIPEETTVHTDIVKGKKREIVDGEEVIVDSQDYIRWEKTDRKNGATVSFHVKKHNKPKYIEGIKRQLMYFGDYLDVYDIDSEGVKNYVHFASKVLLETPLFKIVRGIITVPHILINNVNYGPVDFAEIGINKKFGSVALKGTPTDVNVMSNRESLKWDDKAREFVLRISDEANIQAGKILQEELNKIDNPIERYFASNKLSFQGTSDRDYIINTLKAFSGDISPSFNLNPQDYLDDKQKLIYKAKSISIKEILYIYSYFRVTLISKGSSTLKVVSHPNLAELDFSRIVFKVEEKFENIRTSEALYVFNKVLMGNPDSFVYISIPSKAESIKSFEDYDEILQSGEKAKLLKKIKEAKVPEVIASLEKDLEDLNNKIQGMYLNYIKREKTIMMAKAIFINILKKFSLNADEYLIESNVKAYAKVLRLASDSALTTKKEEATTHQIHTVSDRDAQRAEWLEMKKSKQIFPVRMLNYGGTRFFNSDGFTRINLVDIKLVDLVKEIESYDNLEDKASRAILIYGETEDKDLLDFLYRILAFIGGEKGAGYLPSYNPLNPLRRDIPVLLTVAKDNIKIIKNIPWAIHIKDYILSKTISNNKMNIEFKPALRDFITCIRLLQITKEYPLADIIRGNVLLHNNSYFKNLLYTKKAQELLSKFPIEVKNTSDESIISTLLSGIKYKSFEETLRSFFSSIESLIKIQELPWIELEESQKAMLSKFESYKIDLYDKELCEGLIKEIGNNKERIEKSLMKVAVTDAFNYDHPILIDYLRNSEILLVEEEEEIEEEAEFTNTTEQTEDSDEIDF
jgi:hypothetical protein